MDGWMDKNVHISIPMYIQVCFVSVSVSVSVHVHVYVYVCMCMYICCQLYISDAADE